MERTVDMNDRRNERVETPKDGLLACPFCGATAITIRSPNGELMQRVQHTSDCYFGWAHLFVENDDRIAPWNRRANEKLSGGTPSAQVPCSACGGTGQDDPPPGKYHGLCPKCGGSGKQNTTADRWAGKEKCGSDTEKL